ncbi:MAG: hypothetical protein V2J55_17015 [Candidatus Competibacteraceae bacterium]|nr:hypothetical protein [Candidatus Competibacteraceae bacterium]
MINALHLVIPNLLGPAWIQAGRLEPDAPALLRLLNRADAQNTAGQGVEEVLLRLFGVNSDGDWPVAAISRLGEDDIDPNQVAEDWWIRADPVHLQADLKQVLLTDNNPDIELEQAQTWVAELNALYEDADWRFESPHPNRWYLHLNDDPGLRTHPLSEMAGRNIAMRLPQGPASPLWQARLTEIQMLLHNSSLNEAREAQGQLTINSVWFWGSGRLPQRTSHSITDVHASDPLSCGLARWSGATLAPVPANAGEWQATANCGEHLVVLTTRLTELSDYTSLSWFEQLETLERDWFVPCLSLLKTGLLKVLTLHLGNARIYAITRRSLRRFWRRTQPLAMH